VNAAVSNIAPLRPLELRNHTEGCWLEIEWSDAVIAVIPHRLLREACRCAACVAAERAGQAVTAQAGVRVDSIEAYGPNALRLIFSDGHDRGLFPFEYLRALPVRCREGVGKNQQEKELAKPSSSSGLK
jgi:DUF971 family protein